MIVSEKKIIIFLLVACFLLFFILLRKLDGGSTLDKIKLYNELDNLSEKLGKLKFQRGQLEAQLKLLGKHDTANTYTSKENFTLPIVIIAHNRPTVSRAIKSVLDAKKFVKGLPHDMFPIYVSQDGNDTKTKLAIDEYSSEVHHIYHEQLGNVPKVNKRFQGYYKLSVHYKYALNYIFAKNERAVGCIILEDDLDVSQDILSYFYSTLPILINDPSLYCISAWNDNGKKHLIDLDSPGKIYRTDFFPGLGWMLLRKHWNELSPKWPKGFWDEFMRDPLIRLDRSCLRPEISRTRTFGKKGVSGGQFYESHLKYIYLNQVPVNFSLIDLSAFSSKVGYDTAWQVEVYEHAQLVKSANEVWTLSKRLRGPFRIEYSSSHQFIVHAKSFGVMSDQKRGVPRCAYKGVIPIFMKGVRIYIAPKLPWLKYE